MNRLTIEQLEYYRNTYDKYEGIESNEFEKICNELIEYKKLEEQLGCPLDVVFKALKDGIYIKDMCDIGIGNKLFGVRLDTQNYDCEYVLRTYKDTISVCVKDYKKTWWLKEDKSE